MDFLGSLAKLLGGNNTNQKRPQVQAPQSLRRPVQQLAPAASMRAIPPEMSHLRTREQGIPVGQPIPQDYMNSFSPQTRALAEVYNQNPQDSRVAHLDPAMFGYRADDTVAPIRQNPQSFLDQLLNRYR